MIYKHFYTIKNSYDYHHTCQRTMTSGSGDISRRPHIMITEKTIIDIGMWARATSTATNSTCIQAFWDMKLPTGTSFPKRPDKKRYDLFPFQQIRTQTLSPFKRLLELPFTNLRFMTGQ